MVVFMLAVIAVVVFVATWFGVAYLDDIRQILERWEKDR